MPVFFKEGYYEGEIQSLAFVKSKDKGTPGIELTVAVDKMVSSVDQARLDVPEKSIRTIKLWITVKNREFTDAKLQELGWPGGAYSTLEPSNPNHFSLVGKRCICRNKKSEAQGQYGEWDLASSKPRRRESDPAVSNQLDAMFGGMPANAPAVAAGDMPF